MRRRWSGAAITTLLALVLGIVGVWVLSAESRVVVEPPGISTGKLRICHVSDFHAAVERRADRIGKQYYMRCPGSKFALSKATVIKKILTDSCDLKIFTGDLMHGGDYDLLEQDNHLVTGELSTLSGIASSLLPYWGIDLWTPGNHEVSARSDLEPYVGENQPSLIGSNLKSAVGTVLPYKRITLTTPVAASVCVFGLIRPELVDQAPATFSASDPIESIHRAYEESLADGCGEPGTLVILLSHSGWDEDLKLIRALEESPRAPRVHLILGGHTHNLIPITYPLMVNDTALSHVGAYGGWVGVVTMEALSTAPVRRFKYTPWAHDSRESDQHQHIWKLNLPESKRISTRYRTVRRQSAQPKSTTTIAPRALGAAPETLLGGGVAKSSFEDEVEHGHLIRELQKPLTPLAHKSILDYTLMSYATFKALCQLDSTFLQDWRGELEQIVGNLTKQHVAELPPNTTEQSIECRRGQCKLGKWIGQAIMLAPTATTKIAIHCPVASVTSDRRNAAAAESDEVASQQIGHSLQDVNTVLGVVQAGVIRSRVPPECESPFELFAGGCQLRSPSTHLDLYDIERLLPFHNKIRVIVLKTLNSLCSMLHSSAVQWATHSGSFPGVLHFGNLQYFLNSQMIETENWTDLAAEGGGPTAAPAKGRVPFFDELWPLLDEELLGVQLTNLRGEEVRGGCLRSTSATELTWHCREAECEKKIGRILLLGTELLLSGADGAIIRWHEHADKDFLRSVASRLVPEESTLGCWLESLKDFSVNDAAALFLNASIAMGS